MMLRYYWFNVWFPTLDAYFKMQFWDRSMLFYLIRPLIEVWWHFLFLNVFEIWATYVIIGWCFTFSVVRYQITRRLILYDCVCKVMVVSKKTNFFALLQLLVVSSLFHQNVISSWIDGRFTGLTTSILCEFSAFSILEEVILRDPSQITIDVARCQLYQSWMWY